MMVGCYAIVDSKVAFGNFALLMLHEARTYGIVSLLDDMLTCRRISYYDTHSLDRNKEISPLTQHFNHESLSKRDIIFDRYIMYVKLRYNSHIF
jgi:hypothetical protein